MNDSSDTQFKMIAGGIIGVIAIIILFFLFCFRIVGVGQVGILTTLGNVSGEQQSGVVIKAPWPIQRLVIMNIKTQKEQSDASAASKDLQTVTATVALNYHLTSATAKKVYQDVGTNYQDVIIDPILQESVKSVTSQYNAEELISKRSDVATNLNDTLTKKLTDRGITVDNVSITNFDFSKEFDDAIEQKQVAQQNAQKAQYDLQTAQTQAQANSVQSQALTAQILQQQAIAKWNGVLPTTVAGGTSGETVFNIPLGQ